MKINSKNMQSINEKNINKIAVITGATSGLGASYAKHFASIGYDLIITGRRKDVLDNYADELKNKYKVNVDVVIAELSNREGVDKVISQMKGKDISVLVNNAGFGMKPYFADADINEVEKMNYLHTDAVILLTHAVLKYMKEKNEGIIINISSDGALVLLPKNVIYSATKLFIKQFTEGLYMELIDTNIKVQVVCPGFMKSHFHEAASMNSVDKEAKGLMKFMDTDDVVNLAMEDLKRGKVVSIPSINTKMLVFIANLIPKKIYYKMATRLVKKKFSKPSTAQYM